MSWFKHTPPKHPPLQKHHLHPHRSSPATQKSMDEAKETSPKKREKVKKS